MVLYFDILSLWSFRFRRKFQSQTSGSDITRYDFQNYSNICFRGLSDGDEKSSENIPTRITN